VVIVVIVAAIILAGPMVNLYYSQPPSSQQNQETKEWVTIRTFTGSGNLDTEDFTVATGYWRIIYTTQASNEQFAGFSAYVYPSGETTYYITHADLDKSGTGTSYVRADPGNFWIKVLAANLYSWTIQIQTQQ
jgi:hypothetical protein